MLYEYESVFYPEGSDGWNYRWITNEVRFLLTEKLVEQYLYYQQVLDIHRCKEPAKKRKNKSEYKTWIRLTHANSGLTVHRFR